MIDRRGIYDWIAKSGVGRSTDLKLLAALLDDGSVELTRNERTAFDDMRFWLDKHASVELMPAQRSWLCDVAERLGVDPRDPAEKNRSVPRGRDVPTPAALAPESLRRALEARRGRKHH